MPFPVILNVLSIFGTTQSEGEADVWSMRLHLDPGAGASGPLGAATPAEETALMDNLSTDITTWWNALSGYYSQRTQVDGFKLNAIGTDGRYIDKTRTVRRDFATPLKGTVTTGTLPHQCALAVTLLTSANRGLASKGRVYMPAMTPSLVDVEGRVPEGNRAFIESTWRNLIVALNAEPAGVVNPGVVSVASSVRTGAVRPVTAVRVGDRWDVQRRRASKFREHYLTKTGTAV